MARVRSTDTTPELTVRRLVHAMGYRYRLHRKDLPGCPDLTFVARKKVILVHGCFWHQHQCKRGRRPPATRRSYWRRKLQRNIERDGQVRRKLKRLGWRVLIVWECALRPARLTQTTRRIRRFLES